MYPQLDVTKDPMMQVKLHEVNLEEQEAYENYEKISFDNLR